MHIIMLSLFNLFVSWDAKYQVEHMIHTNNGITVNGLVET
jgi:hypothetical protein